MTSVITMHVRVVGGDPVEVVRALRHAGHIVETRLLGSADTAWTIKTEEPIGQCRGGDYCDEKCPGAGRCGE